MVKEVQGTSFGVNLSGDARRRSRVGASPAPPLHAAAGSVLWGRPLRSPCPCTP